MSSGNISPKSHLLQCSKSTLYLGTHRFILQFAILGYIGLAARLVMALNNYDFYHDQFGQLKALWFLWDLCEKEEGVPWPEDEKEKVREAVRKRHAKANRENLKNDRIEGVEEELERMAKDEAAGWYHPTKLPGSDLTRKLEREPTIEQKLEAAQAIIRSFETADSVSDVSM